MVLILVSISEAFSTFDHFCFLETCVLLSYLTLLSPGFYSVYYVAPIQAAFFGSFSSSTLFWVFTVPGSRREVLISSFFTQSPYINSSSFMIVSIHYWLSSLVYSPDHFLECQSHISNCLFDISGCMLIEISSLTFSKHILFLPSYSLFNIYTHTLLPKCVSILNLPHLSESVPSIQWLKP